MRLSVSLNLLLLSLWMIRHFSLRNQRRHAPSQPRHETCSAAREICLVAINTCVNSVEGGRARREAVMGTVKNVQGLGRGRHCPSESRIVAAEKMYFWLLSVSGSVLYLSRVIGRQKDGMLMSVEPSAVATMIRVADCPYVAGVSTYHLDDSAMCVLWSCGLSTGC